MSLREHVWEWVLTLGSWIVVPLMIVGFSLAVLIELHKQRKQRKAR
jgi:hypothetical protein